MPDYGGPGGFQGTGGGEAATGGMGKGQGSGYGAEGTTAEGMANIARLAERDISADLKKTDAEVDKTRLAPERDRQIFAQRIKKDESEKKPIKYTDVLRLYDRIKEYNKINPNKKINPDKVSLKNFKKGFLPQKNVVMHEGERVAQFGALPSIGVSGILGGMLDMDMRGLVWGPELSLERKGGHKSYVPEDPLKYMTAGETAPGMMEGIVATDYANRQYYDPTPIAYAAKGGHITPKRGLVTGPGGYNGQGIAENTRIRQERQAAARARLAQGRTLLSQLQEGTATEAPTIEAGWATLPSQYTDYYGLAPAYTGLDIRNARMLAQQAHARLLREWQQKQAATRLAGLEQAALDAGTYAERGRRGGSDSGGIMATDYANNQYYDPTYLDYSTRGRRIAVERGGRIGFERGGRMTPKRGLVTGPGGYQGEGGGPRGSEERMRRQLGREAMGAYRAQGGGELKGNPQWLQFRQNYINSGIAQWRAQQPGSQQAAAAQQQAAADAAAAQQAAQQQAAADAAAQQAADAAAAQQAADAAAAQQQSVADAQAQAGQVTTQTQVGTQAGTQVPYAPMPDPIVYRGPGATQTYGGGQTQFHKPRYLDYAAMGATPGSLTEQGVFGGIPTTTDDWFFGNKGGRVGRTNGGMMIIEDNDVVNNGMGAILNKYKQIRSEL